MRSLTLPFLLTGSLLGAFGTSALAQNCTVPASGLVSWWRGQNNALDSVGGNHGALSGNTSYGAGKVGAAFVLDGDGDSVNVGNPPGLRLQNFTIEAWIRRASSSVTSLGPYTQAQLFGYGGGGYGFGINDDGRLFLTRVDFDNVTVATAVTDTNAHHVAVTKSGTNVIFYVDGAAYPAPTYPTVFTFSSSAAIGKRGDVLNDSFFGSIDEVSLYNRALSPSEILAVYDAGAAGKCAPPPPPCSNPPGLISWWGGENSPADSADGNTGTLVGNTSYGAGRVGQTFVFDGDNDAVNVGNPANLQLQNLTIEAWIKRSDPAVVNTLLGTAEIFAYGNNGYAFGINNNGTLFLSKVGVSSVTVVTTITDTNWHHVAMTKTGTNVIFYADSVPFSTTPYNPGFSFASQAAIGARGDNLLASFLGRIDELSIYDRALSAAEVQAIFNGNTGKCPAPPAVQAQPLGKTVAIGSAVSFSVIASGSPPLQYQWRFNGVNLFGATEPVLVLTNVQASQAGYYSVMVSNVAGQAISSNALLYVVFPGSCMPAPSGLVSWWTGENSLADSADGNTGTLVGNTSYGAGRVGQTFVFDGDNDAVNVGNPANLQLQNLTIEAWIKRSDPAVVNTLLGTAEIFAYGNNGYAFGINNNGTLFLSKVGISSVTASSSITDTNWHHVAMTKTGTNVVFYADGVAFNVPPYNTTFTFGSPGAIGARGDNLLASFLGRIDELSIYNRALSAAEVQGIFTAGGTGKCAPSPLSQPGSSVPPGKLQVEQKDGQLHLSFLGAARQPHFVQVSTNLVDWTTLGTALDAEASIYEFTDALPSDPGACFYRVLLP